MSGRLKRARRARGGPTPKGGRLPHLGVNPQEEALERARRRAKRSRRLLKGEGNDVGFRGKRKRRATEKRRRQARARQRKLAA